MSHLRAFDLVELAECMHVAPALARWHVAEWAHLYDHWDEPMALAEFEAMNVADRVPTTWVAFEPGRRSVGAILGSISLIDDDELAGYRERGPWLASLFVVPEARSAGVGRRLTEHVVDAARRLGFDQLYLFTSGQEQFYRALGWRIVDHVDARGHVVTVMRHERSPRVPRRAVVSRWISDPWVGGAYSYLRVGGTSQDRRLLGAPVGPGLYLAGEATSAEHPGTAHGAWFSGERSADLVVADRAAAGHAIVIGAGFAGLAAARRLTESGWRVSVLEAATEPGGRARVDRSLGGPLPLGATWAHGTIGNPFYDAARAVGVVEVSGVFDTATTHVVDHGRLAPDQESALKRQLASIERRFDALASEPGEDRPLGPSLRAELDGVEPGVGRDVMRTWLRSEFENLYAAPVDDLSLRFRSEPFGLSGPDVMLAGDLGAVIARQAEGLAIQLGTAARRVTRKGDGWLVTIIEPTGASVEMLADAVVVTASLAVLQRGAIEFSPPLPAEVIAALGRIGVGPVAKAFFTFESAWWAPDPAFWCAGPSPATFEFFVDVSAFLGTPTLCAFAVGQHAHDVEQMSPDELREAAAAVLLSVRGPGDP